MIRREMANDNELDRIKKIKKMPKPESQDKHKGCDISNL